MSFFFLKKEVLSRSVFLLLMINTLLLSIDGISKTHMVKNSSIPIKKKKPRGRISRSY